MIGWEALIHIAEEKADDLDAQAGKADVEEANSLRAIAKQVRASTRPLRIFLGLAGISI